jgi:SAM-dependent methyltransferase
LGSRDEKRWEHFPASAYLDRPGRNRFLAEQFPRELTGSVLNVGGGGHRHLASSLPSGARYTEIDVSGAPDVRIDLERELPLPFEDRAFDTVICTDALEHLDNLHAVFAEMCRVSSSAVIVSLPNTWPGILANFFAGRGDSGKFYGLPLTRPDDRHKWFFSFTEAENFLANAGTPHGFSPERWLAMGYVNRPVSRRLLRHTTSSFFGSQTRFNLFASAIWVLLRRDSAMTKAASQ